MNGWGANREVEKVKPFEDRAAECAHALNELRRLYQRVIGKGEIPDRMGEAEKLLIEAVERGIKGKEPKP